MTVAGTSSARFLFAGEVFEADRSISGPLPAPNAMAADCRVRRIAERPAIDSIRWIDDADAATSGYRLGRREAEHFLFLADYAMLAIDENGQSISYWTSDDLDEVYISHLILDHALPTRLGVLGRSALHGTCVSVGGAAVAFVGPTGSGKSTVAASFAASGHPLLADDCLVLECHGDQHWVVPTYPGTRLSMDSIQQLFGPAVREAGPVSDRYPKRLLTGTDGLLAFSDASCPLAAIVLLARRRPGAPRLHAVAPLEALGRLLEQTWYTEAVGPALGDLIGRIGALVHGVTVLELVNPDDLSRLAASKDLMLEYFQADGSAALDRSPDPAHAADVSIA